MFHPIRRLVKVRDGLKALQLSKISSEAVKNFQDIPSPPCWPFIGHLASLIKNEERLDKYMAELQKQYGDMVRLKLPGNTGNMLILYQPEHIKSMFTEEERIPQFPGKGMRH